MFPWYLGPSGPRRPQRRLLRTPVPWARGGPGGRRPRDPAAAWREMQSPRGAEALGEGLEMLGVRQVKKTGKSILGGEQRMQTSRSTKRPDTC